MDPRSLADGAFQFFRPDPAWRKHARYVWIGACVSAAIVLFALAVKADGAASGFATIDANLAYGFARIDPQIVYQEIRGRYAFCGYDWDRRCQLRDPSQTSPPAVDRWLALYPPSFALTQPPAQADVAFMEAQGATSLLDDPRFADTEYLLGLQDVVAHVFGTMAAGGLPTFCAFGIALALGFATFGTSRMRSINPIWYGFAMVGAAFYAWALLHILAEPAGFAIVLASQMVATAAVPVAALVRLRKTVARRETIHSYWSGIRAPAVTKGAPTPAP